MAANEIVFPVDTTPSVIESQSPNRWCFAKQTNGHHDYNAADIFAPTGTRIVSPVAGRITKVTHASSGMGSRVQLHDDNARLWYLAHMHHSPDLEVVEGQRVSPGTLIGYVGTKEHAAGTQPHLHIDMLPSPHTSRPSCKGAGCKDHPFENIQPLLVAAYNGSADEPPPAPLGNGSVIARANDDGTYLEAILAGGHALTLSGQDKIDLSLDYARVIDAAEFSAFIDGPIADGSVLAKNVGGAWSEAVMGGGHAFLLSEADKSALGLGPATGIPASDFDRLLSGPIADGSVYAKNVGGAWSEAVMGGGHAFLLSEADKSALGLGPATGIPASDFDRLLSGPIADGSVYAKNVGGAWSEAVMGGGHAFLLSEADKSALGLGPATGIPASDFDRLLSGPIADGSVYAKNVGGAWSEAVMGGGHAFLLSEADKSALGLGPATGIPASDFDRLLSGPIADGSVYAKNVGGASSKAIVAGGRAFGLTPEDETSLGPRQATGIPAQDFDWLAANTIAERTVIARRNADDTYLEAYIVDGRAVLLTQEDKIRLGLGLATVIPTASFNSLLP